jgi:N-acetylmuramoyl-L-alanine amidase
VLIKKIIISLVFALTINIVSAQAICQIKDFRLWPSPEGLRLVFDLSEPVQYSVSNINHPYRIVIDLANADLVGKLPKVDKQWLKNIRLGKHSNNMLRIVLELDKQLKASDFLLTPNERYGHRLVIDLTLDQKHEIMGMFDLDAQPPTNDKFIIAIDAGHGGEDPGAVGKFSYEKDVTLAIAKILCDKINKEKKMQAFLTRDGDYFIGLRNRMIQARSKSADLFLSIHADAFKNTNADGASVFILSEERSSSEAAQWLADSENKADLIGGVKLIDKSELLANVLLDLSQTANSSASLQAANFILNDLRKTTKLHKFQVEKAGFAVLRAPDMPSVLIESGFISNPQTEKKLNSSSHQEKLANSILQGIKNFAQHKN